MGRYFYEGSARSTSRSLIGFSKETNKNEYKKIFYC